MNSSKNNSGFSFVDLSIVLTVMTLLIINVMISDAGIGELRKQVKTLDKLEKIKSHLLSYVKTYGHYPCPADGSLPITDPNFGFGQGSQTGTCLNYNLSSTDADPDEVRMGVVPVKSLGLPFDYMFDSWGNRIMYAVTEKLTAASTYFSGDGNITVLRRHDTTSAPGSQPEANIRMSDTAYVIISYGKDGYGAYKKNGDPVRVKARNIAGGDCTIGDTCKDSVEQIDNHHLYTTTSLPQNITYAEPDIDRVFMMPGAPLTTSQANKVQFDDTVCYDRKFYFTFNRSYGGRPPTGIAKTPDGGFVVLTSVGGAPDYASINKHNNYGDVQWSKRINLNQSKFYDVVADSAGDIIAVGSMNNAGDAIIAKFSSDMTTVRWSGNAKIIDNGSYNMQFTSVAIDSSDNIYAVGYMNTSASGDKDAVIYKFRGSDGVQLWSKLIGFGTTADEDEFKSVIVSPGNEIYAVGYTSGFDSANTCPANPLVLCPNDAVYAKFDTDGNLLWGSNDGVYTWASTGRYNDEFKDIIIGPDGNLIISGFGYPGSPSYKYLLKVSSADQTVIWQKSARYGGLGNIFSMVLSSDNTHILVNSYCQAIAKMDITGSSPTVIWQNESGYCTSSHPSAVLEMSDGRVIATDGDSNIGGLVVVNSNGDFGYSCAEYTKNNPVPQWEWDADATQTLRSVTPSSGLASSDIAVSVSNRSYTTTSMCGQTTHKRCVPY